MHGESHLTFTMGWIRVLKISLKSRSPRLSPAATAHGQGRPFATKLAMMSESIKENERMKVMMAFQKKKEKRIPATSSQYFAFQKVSFPSHHQMTNEFCFNLIFLALVWKHVGILQESADHSRQFLSQFEHIKWLANNIYFTAFFASPHPHLVNPHLRQNRSLTLNYILHFHGRTSHERFAIYRSQSES